MDEKEIINLIKSNAQLSANMEGLQKDLARLVQLIEKDVKEDIDELDKRIDGLENYKSKFIGMCTVAATIASLLMSLFVRYAPTIFGG